LPPAATGNKSLPGQYNVLKTATEGDTMPQCDAVFEGGGVKGIGLVGAVAAVEDAGYKFENLAGTSAGAIVASLLAVGYTGAELGDILRVLDYTRFRDEGLLDKFGLPGKALSILCEYGLYEGTYFEHWLDQLLRAKDKITFGDIRMPAPTQEKYTYKFQAIAADLTDRRLLVLPGDLRDFGFDPDTFPIARAVRMSMSIPIFYEPVRLTDRSGREHLIVDGGILSNYPLWLLDDGSSDPPWPTFGFKLAGPGDRSLPAGESRPLGSLAQYLEAVVGALIDAQDTSHISRSCGDYQRTILIPTVVAVGAFRKPIATTDFAITPEESAALFANGWDAAKRFLAAWDFAAWKGQHRRPARQAEGIAPRISGQDTKRNPHPPTNKGRYSWPTYTRTSIPTTPKSRPPSTSKPSRAK
jgi:NTE family protein